MPNGWRTINSLVHKIRLHGRRGEGMAESFSRQKSRHAPQKEGGLKTLCDLPPVWTRLVRPTNLMSRMDGKKTQTHILIGPWWPAKAAPVWNYYLEVYWPCAGGLSAVNTIGTQLRDPITRDLPDGVWRFKYINGRRRGTREESVNKHHVFMPVLLANADLTHPL